MHLAHPLGVQAHAHHRVKKHERDATDLADLLPMNRLPEAWIAPPAVRELHEAARALVDLLGLPLLFLTSRGGTRPSVGYVVSGGMQPSDVTVPIKTPAPAPSGFG